MLRGLVAVLLLIATGVYAQTEPVPFPAGTATFFDTGVSDAAVAADGGVWVAAADGLVRYTAAGPGVVLPVAGGRPYALEIAGDGSIWFANTAGIARIATSGAILEQYPLVEVRALAIATDGALWYARGDRGSTIGRIAGGTVTELPSPAHAWSIAPAGGGDLWILGNGFATAPDSLHRMTAAGAVTELPLGHDVLFGELQALPDGTLYVGTGFRSTVLRLAPGAQTFEVIPIREWGYLADAAGNLWVADIARLRYIGSSGAPNLAVDMPHDPRDCSNIPAYMYKPLAIDSAGGVWLQISDVAGYIPTPIPCNEPEPPPLPDLIRIDGDNFLHGHLGQNVPALSPMMLAVLAIAIGVAAIWHMRGAGLAVLLLLNAAAFAQELPPGTVTFSGTKAFLAVPARGGGVWAGSEDGITHYTTAGAGATYALPFGSPPGWPLDCARG